MTESISPAWALIPSERSSPPSPPERREQRSRRLWRWLDAAYLLLLTVYLFGGLSLIPMHGDETSFIWASQDWAHLVLQRDLDRLRYDASRGDPVDVELQNERLATGPLHHYAIGLAWTLAGYNAADIPSTDWNWDYTWDQNEAAGLIPPSGMLIAARAASTVGLALGLIGVFWLGRVIQGRGLAYLTALLYAINPILLLNGRRAMSEGMLIGMTMLALAAAAQYLQARPLIPQPLPPRRGEGGITTGSEVRWLVLIGVLCGLAFSVKHNGAVVGIIVGGAISVVTLIPTRSLIGAIWRVALIGGAALVISFALAPAYWFDPAGTARAAWGLRDFITGAHSWTWGGYESAGERIGALYRILFDPTPQYFDVPPWAAYLADTIWAYRASPFSGVSFPSVILGGLAVIGLAALITRMAWGSARERVVGVLVLAWMVISIGFTYALIRLEWQRYYVPLVPVALVLQGMGVAWLATVFRKEDQPSRRRVAAVGLVAVLVGAALLFVRARIVERIERPTRVMHFDTERDRFRLRAVNWNFDNGLRLRHMEVVPVSPHSGEVAYIRLVWELTGAPVSDEYATIVEMVNWDNLTVAQVDSGYDIPFQTSSWIPGTVIEERLALRIPPGTPPGGYVLNVRLFAPRSGVSLEGRISDAALGRFVSIPNWIGVTRPNTPVEPDKLELAERFDRPLTEDIHLIGSTIQPAENEVGQPFYLTLGWQASDRLQDAYYTLDFYWQAEATVGQPPDFEINHFVPPQYHIRAPLTDWESGDVWKSTHLVYVPAELEAGEYVVFTRLRTQDGKISAAAEVGRMTVGTPTRIFDRPHIQHSAGMLWDVILTNIQLAGYDLREESTSPIMLTLYWQSNGTIGQYLTRFVHLIDASGNIVAQNDSVPQGGARPTTGWIPGEVIAEAITLDASPGEYQVRVGWYDARTGERIPLLALWGGGDFTILPTGVSITD